MSDARKVLNALETLATVAKSVPFAPPAVQQGAEVASVLIRAANGEEHYFGRDDLLATQGAAAGQAAYNASRFAGLREAIRATLERHIEDAEHLADAVDETLAEVTARWPQ